ncbi:MAG: HipA domain-containing protein [Coriobacteriales bacterium]
MAGIANTLDVYIAGRRCGALSEDKAGSISFAYDPGYEGVPLSLSMPVGLERFPDRVVRPFLMGLLPDEASTRSAIGARFGISGNNPFRLLGLLGLDCPGAVQVCAEGTAPPEETPSDLIPLSSEQIEAKLAAMREDAAAAWLGTDLAEGHWSLAGCQAKAALRLEGDRWFKCRGTAASTHILKPGVVGLGDQALVEYLSMRIASRLGLPAAEVDYEMFGAEPAVIIRRYDRLRNREGAVVRIHQEDLCQALGVMPDAKYAEQGGPTTPQIIDLLRKTGPHARENVYRFILCTFFNYLIGATDAHAKNHSLLWTATDSAALAPLYDVASIAPYHTLSPSRRKPLRAALSIGGENRFGMLGAEHVEKMVESCRLGELRLGARMLCARLEEMARAVPAVATAVVGEARAQGLAGIDNVGDALVEELSAHCRRTLELL